MTVKIIELISGEKLIGNVIASDNLILMVENIFAIIPQSQMQNGPVTFGFGPWPIFRNENEEKAFEINKSSIVIIYDPNFGIMDHYNRQIAQQSGLILPPSLKVSPGKTTIIS